MKTKKTNAPTTLFRSHINIELAKAANRMAGRTIFKTHSHTPSKKWFEDHVVTKEELQQAIGATWHADQEGTYRSQFDWKMCNPYRPAEHMMKLMHDIHQDGQKTQKTDAVDIRKVVSEMRDIVAAAPNYAHWDTVNVDALPMRVREVARLIGEMINAAGE